MRTIIAMAIFLTGTALAGWNDYEEVRELTIDAGGVQHLVINAGAGSLKVAGVEGSKTIDVTATIGVATSNEEKAARVMSKKMTLTLDRDGDAAELKAWFDDGFLGSGPDGYIALVINVPTGTALTIDDGAGSIDVIGVEADITIDDGAGSIDIRRAASINIDDGSGSLKIRDANGDVFINDGSGSIKVQGVAGTVTIDDGSGSIKVSDVEKDLVIVDDGSGGQSFSDIRGDVVAET